LVLYYCHCDENLTKLEPLTAITFQPCNINGIVTKFEI
jgi:hypothetical protein